MISMDDFLMIMNLFFQGMASSFSVLDGAVFIDSPRISLLDLAISDVFLTLIFGFIVWVLGGSDSDDGPMFDRDDAGDVGNYMKQGRTAMGHQDMEFINSYTKGGKR